MEKDVFDFVLTFISIIWEAFPFVVLGAVVAGILEEVVPQQALAKLIPQNRLLAVCVGGVLGLVFPMCECGIVPVMRRLLRKGLPLGTCVAYMLAGPIINLVVISSTYVAFGPHGIGNEMVALRVGLGFLVAVTTALIVQGQYATHGNKLLTPLAAPQQTKGPTPEVIAKDEASQVHPSQNRAGESKPFFQRIANISETALHDFIDIMVFLTLGACMAALVKGQFTTETVESISKGFPAVTILGMMVAAIVMCLCSEADAFVAASFTTLHPSAKIAFLVLGPMFDFKLLLMFTRVFRRRVIVTVFLSVFIQVFVYSMAVHYLWSYIVPTPTAAVVVEGGQ
ncbi:permease [Zavarzinella formosa]|uniref:permease n=1 Tax=Zavarzinella formosa TaxID=360055 RepID=UPI0003111FC9|nr:permease [Zavarzinella formosa]